MFQDLIFVLSTQGQIIFFYSDLFPIKGLNFIPVKNNGAMNSQKMIGQDRFEPTDLLFC